jgi:RimJ/RimL family protein N-acetyltransferase
MTPTLTTARLTLGPVSMAHFAAFADFAATDHSRFMGGPGDRRDAWDSVATHAGQWALRGYGTFWLTDRAGAPVGRVGVWHPEGLDEPELSWVIYEPHTRQGLAVEAASAVLGWWSGQGRAAPMSLIAPDNVASIGVARALGAGVEGTHLYDHGKEVQRWRHRGAA